MAGQPLEPEMDYTSVGKDGKRRCTANSRGLKLVRGLMFFPHLREGVTTEPEQKKGC